PPEMTTTWWSRPTGSGSPLSEFRPCAREPPGCPHADQAALAVRRASTATRWRAVPWSGGVARHRVGPLGGHCTLAAGSGLGRVRVLVRRRGPVRTGGSLRRPLEEFGRLLGGPDLGCVEPREGHDEQQRGDNT